MSRKDLSFYNNFDLFDPFFGDDFFKMPREEKHHEVLRTDVIENENDYELVTDVPGIKKENITLDIEDGYLTISVTKDDSEDVKNKNFIRKERHSFQAKRSFYVGNIEESSIKAKLDNGELHIVVPKEQQKIETKKQIAID